MYKKLLGDGTQVDMLDGIMPELLKGLSGSQISNNLGQSISEFNQKQLSSLTDPSKNPIIGDIKKSAPIKLTATEKVQNSGFGQFMNKNSAIFDAATSGMKAAKNIFHSNRTGLQQSSAASESIKDAQYGVLKSIPITAPFAQAAELLDSTLGAITGGLGSATSLDKTLTAIPLVGNMAAVFAGKTDTFKGDIQDINTGDFGGVVSDATRAKEISGVKSLQKRKLNNQIRAAQDSFNFTSNIIDANKKRLNNNIGQDLQSAMLSKYQGNQQIMLSKKGSKFPELDVVRAILESSKVKSFKYGGKIEKENIIPTGALHKNLHHIEEANPELEGKITKKGIPVGTYDDNGEFQQTCEVESGELIIDLKHTKYIEDLHDEYKRIEDDNIAIECGKFLVSQIFSNTKDNDKVIKKTE